MGSCCCKKMGSCCCKKMGSCCCFDMGSCCCFDMGSCCCKEVLDREREPLVPSPRRHPCPGAMIVDFTESPPPAATPHDLTRYPPSPLLTDRRINTSEFQYLDEDVQCEGYKIKSPKFESFPALQHSFKKVYDKYEIVLLNRQKVDDSLKGFKAALEVDKHLHMSGCFEKWHSLLHNPKFTIMCKKPDKSVVNITDLLVSDSAKNSLEDERTHLSDCQVKTIKVEPIQPRNLQRAERHINELLEACHMFLQQFQFLWNAVLEGLGEASVAKGNIGRFTEHMGQSDRTDLKGHISRLFEDYEYIPGLMSKFQEHVIIILREITDSAYCLRVYC